MSLCLIYDDRRPVPEEIRSLLGVDRFGEVVYRKRSLLAHVSELVRDAGIREIVHLSGDADLEGLKRAIDGGPPRRYLYFPSHMVPRDAEAAGVFLRKIQFADGDLVMKSDADAPMLLVGEAAARDLLGVMRGGEWGEYVRSRGRDLSPLRGEALFQDISRYGRFVEFLSSNFDARYFNRLEGDAFTVRKRSTDRAKMRREFTFHTLLRGPVEAFFLRPFDFQEDEEGASYRAERLNVPDVSIQWIHGALDAQEFAAFLDRIVMFLRARPARRIEREAFAAESARLYREKLEERLSMLRRAPQYPALARLVAGCTALGSVDDLAMRWRALWERLRADAIPAQLAFTHGDMCFSNILYDKRTGMTKFVDPRGAETEAELFSHPYYDIAKLSHSVLGGYDFINHGLFEVRLSAELSASLTVESPDLSRHHEVFIERMEELGYERRLIRLFEASLFLSMLPLHLDVPKKTLAFTLRAGEIIEGLEREA